VSHRTVANLSTEERQKLHEWLLVQGDGLPDYVRTALQQHEALVEALSGNTRKLSHTLLTLRRALGIIPSSERRRSKDPLGALGHCKGRPPANEREKLQMQVARGQVLADWHEKLQNRHRKKVADAKVKLMKVEDIPLSPEEESQIAASQARFVANLKSGGDEPELALQSPQEALMRGAQVQVIEELQLVSAAYDPKEDGKLLKTFVEERTRYDFSLSLRRLDLQIEKHVVLDSTGERRILSASTADIGPPRYAVTWEFLAYMTILVVQYAMPMNRLANLLSTKEKRFSASMLSRLLRYVAQRFVPIYFELLDGLAECDILMGDDTTTRVVEVQRYFSELATNPENEPPWASYRHQSQARATLEQDPNCGLGAELASELGFEFARRSRSGHKTQFHTTTLAGKSLANDPRSQIVLYRSHLGSFGNLLEMLLQKRQAHNKNLIIQSDLATVNLIVSPKLLGRFAIRYAGCAAHARRPFSSHEHEDSDSCSYMLHLFKGLFIYEHNLDLQGRNRKNVLAVRQDHCQKLWEEIRNLAQEIQLRWSPETKLGEGAGYIIRNYEKLTAYLHEPRLSPSNNFSERMLRLEKLIEASSMFRRSLEGRFALDIMRSVLQTAIAAGVALDDYILDVLRISPVTLAATSEQWTPFAYAKRVENNSH
jgi:hypothetical protein